MKKERILIIDLTEQKVTEQPYDSSCSEYGRGLVRQLIDEYTDSETDRYSESNVIVVSPGFFVGCKAPSACRMFVATCEGKGKGMQVCNTTGNMPQKLGSLGLAAVVIKGRSEQPGTVLSISPAGVRFEHAAELGQCKVSEIIHSLKDRYNKDIAVLGTGKSGDKKMSLATFFCTYPDGTPEYHCPRNGWGDVFGAKNLRAVVVDCRSYFARECENQDDFWKEAKSLTQDIINDEVCGGALPSYGSITIMKILKSRASLAELKESEPVCAKQNKPADGRKRNFTCAPMCAIGCLNRHMSKEGRQYLSPAQAEVEAALVNCFGVEDFDFANEIQHRASEIGIVGTEFVTACKVYAEALNIEHGEKHLLEWIDEIEEGTLTGRIIASRTYGIADLYADRDMKALIDRKAIQDEGLFNVEFSSKYPAFSHLNPIELLYAQIFVLENLGFCIFTSFALLDKVETFEKLAKMYEYRTGKKISAEELIGYAAECLDKEKEFEERRWKEAQKANIPPFTKVLYRYFDANR